MILLVKWLQKLKVRLLHVESTLKLTSSESGADKVNGLLFGSECEKPLLVPIPLVDGFTLPCHVENLKTAHWVESDSVYSTLIDHVFDDECQKQLLSKFVVFCCWQATVPENMRENELITELTFPARTWWGDVLVVKLHNGMVTDIRVEDVALIKQLLVWLVLSFYSQALDFDAGLS